jgi:hypothetical protein
MPREPADTEEILVALQRRNALRARLRDAVLFSRPGNTGVFTLSPAACRILQANPPPRAPAYDWQATPEQTHAWAADQARGRVDLSSYELQATSQVFQTVSHLLFLLVLPSGLVCALPSGSGWLIGRQVQPLCGVSISVVPAVRGPSFGSP